MASRRQAHLARADRIADDLIAQLRDLPGVIEIYSEHGPPGVIVTAFVESDEAERAAIGLELDMARRIMPDVCVDLRVYKPTADVRADYRAAVPDTLEWARDEQGA